VTSKPFRDNSTIRAVHVAAAANFAHNSGLPPLNQQERTYVEAALGAVQILKRTFENWLAIAQGLKSLRDKADALGGKFTFDRLREREGLGPDIISKSRVSKLLTILDRRVEVESWRAILTGKEQFEWASPESVWNKCPIFHPPIPGDEKPAKPSPMAELKRVNLELQEKLHALEQRSDDGSLFDFYKTPPATIASVMFGTSRHRAVKIARAILALEKDAKAPAG
jgi:hypothetical protein